MADIHSIEKAYERIKEKITRTPVITNSTINKLANAEIYFKCENFQKVGAFKFRGATNTLLQLSSSQLSKGVATHSSGNHAQALSLAAKQMGVPAYIVMPNNSPRVKVNAVKDYGANITFCEPTLAARETTLETVIEKTGAEFIHPYNREEIIEGQGTAALELLDEQNDLEIIVAPVGGGGLMSGTSIYSKGFNPNIKVYGAEPSGADDAKRSLQSGKLQPSVNPNTICDGLLTSLGELTFSYIQENVDDILIADDNEIINAMRLIYERMKIIVEPSSAVTLATILKHNHLFKNKKIGVIISGGNVDLDTFFKNYSK